MRLPLSPRPLTRASSPFAPSDPWHCVVPNRAKIIENLSPLNYDTNNLSLEAYDWRLSYYNLEVRDAYFSRLKNKVEVYMKVTGKKTVLVGHSMGGTVILVRLRSRSGLVRREGQRR